ncbi:hypothetical protein KBD33_00950 [Candidatus Gracilibacteria bacterium]|nr:hypothetical protein [Candidatus Gracilibacteria bacterium]
MIQTGRIHHDGGKNILRSHHLHPGNDISLFIIIEGNKESIVSIVEDHILESVSTISWEIHSLDTDFSYLSERYNQCIKSLGEEDTSGLSCLIGLLYDESLSVVTTGGANAILVERDEVSEISSHDSKKPGFHFISHGDIPTGSTVYLSNTALVSLFSESLLCEMSLLNLSEWENTVTALIEEEKYDSIHLFRISETTAKKTRSLASGTKQTDILGNAQSYISDFLDGFTPMKNIRNFLDGIILRHKGVIQYIIFIGGIVLLFLLAYSLVNSLFSVVNTSSGDSKNELIKAQTLIEESKKLTNNKQAFNANIKEAEEILFKLRDEKMHMYDTQKFLGDIEVMKKEVNDIQTVDLSEAESLIKFNPSDLSPKGVFENDKKLSLIGEKGAILGHTRGENLSKIIPYPTGEIAKSFSIGEDGTLFILTQNNRIISPRRNEFGYITVTGGGGWEKSKSIKVFNNNIYLVSEDGKNIFKHRPGVNGFSSRTSMLENLSSQILDISIDGGVYIVEESGKIQRYVSGKTEGGPKGLIINKVPGEYTIGQSDPLKIISQSNLVYVYVLSGDRVWIFSPDSKRFQDVNALTYVAQLELQTEEEVRDIFVPRDGMIYATTNMGVYEIKFELVDGKILLR